MQSIIPAGSSRALAATRLIVFALIIGMVLAWATGAVLWISGLSADFDTILSATFFNGWLVEDIRAAAAGIGVPATAFPIYWFGIEASLLLGFGFMSLLLFFRKPDWFGTYLAVAFMYVGTTIGGPVLSQIGLILPGFQAVLAVLGTASVIVLASVLFLFPDGRFAPRWMKWVAPPLLLAMIGISALQYIAAGNGTTIDIPILEVATMVVPLVSGIASQTYRYVAISSQQERAQTRGVIFSFVCFVLIMVGASVLAPNAVAQAEPPTGYDLIATMVMFTLATLAVLGLVASITFSVLRQQLWDIDVVIRRTTSYAIITGMLALVYVGSVVLLQRVFTAVIGDTSTVAVVLSTLLIAALFLPIRRRVQDIIDRRFFRKKYDAQKTLEQFAQTVRDETDLDALTAELVRVIQDTMQPEFVSVWLAPEAGREATAQGDPSSV